MIAAPTTHARPRSRFPPPSGSPLVVAKRNQAVTTNGMASRMRRPLLRPERRGCTGGKPDCEPDRCAVQAMLDEACPCGLPSGTVAATTNGGLLGVASGTTAATHGHYVSCVVQALKSLAQQDPPAVQKNCRGKITRCAARSTCGKEGAVTCLIPKLGTCDTEAGTCVENSMLACTSDADCVLSTRCKIKRSADRCMAAGGTVGTGTTCCADCYAPTP